MGKLSDALFERRLRRDAEDLARFHRGHQPSECQYRAQKKSLDAEHAAARAKRKG